MKTTTFAHRKQNSLFKTLLRTKKNYSKILLLFIAAVCTANLFAQSSQTFSVTSLNADGLPATILFVKVNEEGPGAKYSKVISQYLTNHPVDFVGLQEDFDFGKELYSSASSIYLRDEFSGRIDLSLADFVNLKVPCDGLTGYWKKQHKVKMERVAWKENYGKFDHSNDDLCTKGFRRYELTTKDGIDLRLYNMHMDASTDEDEAAGKDGPDRECRLKQWIQLRDDIMAHMDDKPVIVMGDMNSYYARDEVKPNFIEAIQESGHATVSDVWIELERDGQYPAHEDGPVMKDDDGWSRKGETLDKILYINPVNSNIRLRPISVNIDRTGYVREDGKTPLGDHFPLSATFVIESTTDIDNLYADDSRVEAIYSTDGRRFPRLQRGLNIVRMSDGTTRKIRY